ncbi:MAG: hypothetical protein LBS53_08980, partial [Synergistaceae bacterium]|nr:hypothetical protein [Synergistaceae bacterium]
MRIARNIGDLIVGINRNKKNIEDACIETEKKEASLYNSKISEAKKKCDREKVLLIGKGSHYLNAKTNIEAHLKHIDGEEAKIPDYLKSILVAGGRKLPYVAGFDELNVVHYVRIRDLIEKINGDTVYAKLKRALAKSPKGFRLLQAIADILGVPPDKIAALHDALQRDVAEAMSTLEAARVFVDGKKVLNEKYLKSEMKRIENECDAAIKRAEVTRNDNIKKARNKRDGELKRENDRLESPDNIRLFNNFNRDMSDFFKRYGVSGRDLSRFSPPTAYPGEFMIGAIEHCLVPSPDQERILRARMPFAYGNGKVLQIPLCIPVNSPGNILVEYDGSAKDTVMSGVQSMILKIFKFMPMFSYNIIYIDPNDRGTNLGIPLKLDRIPSAPSLLQVVASPGDIERVFGELEGFVDETTRAIAGIESVYKYNEGRKAVEAIPYHTIIINDFPHGFTNSSLEVLKVLLNNSEKCGISLVFVTRDAAKVPDAVKRNFLRITAQKGCAIVPFGGEKYAFKFDSTPRREEYEAFIKSVRNVYDKGIEIENRFGKLFNLSRPIPYRDAAEKIKIPFAVDSRGKIIDLELGGSNSAHAFITGDTGSGKSTALHWLISSIALHYRASDVELWLADYLNVEFALYVNNVLPHVKFIGLDKSADFSYSLLVKVQREFEERLEKFKASAVTDIGGYNSNMRNSGKPVMPRILILIDEFHLMSQACEREDKYKTMLSNQVREVRKAGISYILSDQAASKGLPGLSAEAKEMIRVRIAMRNSPDELRETLGIAHSYYTTELNYKIDTMKEGHMIIKRVVGEDAGARVIVDRYKAIFIDRKAGELAITSKHACRRAQDDGYNGERPFVVLKKERTVPDEKAIEEHDRGTGASRDGAIPIHVGTPMTFEPFFYFGLEKQYDNNLIVVGGDDDIRISVLL